jgi:hypothetical protein
VSSVATNIRFALQDSTSIVTASGVGYVDFNYNVTVVNASLPTGCNNDIELTQVFNLGYAQIYGRNGTKCQININTISRVGNKEQVSMRIYQTEYDMCAKTIQTTDQAIIFGLQVVFPTTCNYFQPENNIINLQLLLPNTVINTGTKTMDVTTRAYPKPLLCENDSSMARLEYTLTFSSPIELITIQLPEDLSISPSDYLVPYHNDTSCNSNGVCVCSGGNTCLLKLLSTQCKPIILYNNVCSYDFSNIRTIFTDFIVTRSDGSTVPAIILATSDAFTVPCPNINNPDVIVNSTWDSTLTATNLQGSNQEAIWTNPVSDFSKDMILRLALTNITTGVDKKLELFITNVFIRVTYDENTNTFNNFFVEDKITFMQFSQTPWYKEPLFCRYYEKSTSTCDNFFQLNTRRWTPYNDQTLTTSKLNSYCQKNDDNTMTDFFIINLSNWFMRTSAHTNILVEVEVTGVINPCVHNNRRLLLHTNEDNIITKTLKFTITSETHDDINRILIISISVSIGVSLLACLCLLCFCIAKQRDRHSYVAINAGNQSLMSHKDFY